MSKYTDIGVEFSGHVATIEIQRPPNNFFDVVLINSIADALQDLDKNEQCRAVVLAAQGKSFCAGANFGDGSALDKSGQRPGYTMAMGGAVSQVTPEELDTLAYYAARLPGAEAGAGK